MELSAKLRKIFSIFIIVLCTFNYASCQVITLQYLAQRVSEAETNLKTIKTTMTTFVGELSQMRRSQGLMQTEMKFHLDNKAIHLKSQGVNEPGIFQNSSSKLLVGSGSLRNIKVTVPATAKVNDDVSMLCQFEMIGNATLYAVKWYHDGEEFYRYLPSSYPSLQVFHTKKIHVDSSKSDAHNVHLKSVTKEQSGAYRCEISVDAPNFDTAAVEASMNVVVGPLTPTTSKPGGVTSKSGVTAAPTPAGPINPFNLTFVVSARDLNNKKKNGKVDPYVIVSHRTGTLQEQKDWVVIGQTDTLKSNTNPDFLKVFSFVWTKGKNQKWKFEVKTPHTLSKDEVIGTTEVNIDDYVLQKNQDLTVKLPEGGSLILKKTTPVSIRLYARNVPKMDAFNGASDPFVECYWRKGKDGNDTLFGTTKIIEDSENPDWDQTFEFANYQKGTDMWWHFKVQDSDSVSGNDFVGETLVEIDPFVAKRAAKVNKLSTDANNKATLTVTPA